MRAIYTTLAVIVALVVIAHLLLGQETGFIRISRPDSPPRSWASSSLSYSSTASWTGVPWRSGRARHGEGCGGPRTRCVICLTSGPRSSAGVWSGSRATPRTPTRSCSRRSGPEPVNASETLLEIN